MGNRKKRSAVVARGKQYRNKKINKYKGDKVGPWKLPRTRLHCNAFQDSSPTIYVTSQLITFPQLKHLKFSDS